MKLKHLFDSLHADIVAVAAAGNVDLKNADGGKTGLKAMYAALNAVSVNRAYDDEHPGFKSGHWKRVLPFDGRDYCWYYEGGADDTHVATLLRAILKSL
jgi:hypothetical protein